MRIVGEVLLDHGRFQQAQPGLVEAQRQESLRGRGEIIFFGGRADLGPQLLKAVELLVGRIEQVIAGGGELHQFIHVGVEQVDPREAVSAQDLEELHAPEDRDQFHLLRLPHGQLREDLTALGDVVGGEDEYRSPEGRPAVPTEVARLERDREHVGTANLSLPSDSQGSVPGGNDTRPLLSSPATTTRTYRVYPASASTTCRPWKAPS